MLLSFLISLALAQGGGAGSPPDEEMTVFSARERERQREALDVDLRALGYQRVAASEGQAIYRSEAFWHPTVIIDEDGYALIERSPVRFVPMGEGESRLRYLTCIPPFTVVCVRASGVLVSDRKLQHEKTRIAEYIEPQLGAWRSAVAADAMSRRIHEEIPAMLERIWTTGVAVDGAPPLESPALRRAAILDFWATRTCTPEGDTAREQVQSFLAAVVQTSSDPVTEEERARAEAAGRCEASLILNSPLAVRP